MRDNTFERRGLEDVNAITGFGPAVVPARTAGPPGRVVRDLGRPVLDRPARRDGPPTSSRRQQPGRAGRLRRHRRLGPAPRQPVGRRPFPRRDRADAVDCHPARLARPSCVELPSAAGGILDVRRAAWLWLRSRSWGGSSAGLWPAAWVWPAAGWLWRAAGSWSAARLWPAAWLRLAAGGHPGPVGLRRASAHDQVPHVRAAVDAGYAADAVRAPGYRWAACAAVIGFGRRCADHPVRVAA